MVEIQPPRGAIGGDAGPLGGGWKGVLTWCMQEARGESLQALFRNNDLLIIQLDADVAGENDPGWFGQGKALEGITPYPCPPPGDTTTRLRERVQVLLALEALSAEQREAIVLCTPSMASETWMLVALFPDLARHDTKATTGGACCIECRDDIKSLLRKRGKRLRPKLVESQGGRLKNRSAGFRRQQPQLTRSWADVVQRCDEARRFDSALRETLRR